MGLPKYGQIRVTRKTVCGVQNVAAILFSALFCVIFICYQTQQDAYIKAFYHSFKMDLKSYWGRISIVNLTSAVQVAENSTDRLNSYYVYMPHCKIRYIDPFTRDAQRNFNPNKKMHCAKGPNLIRAIYDISAKRYMLHINEDVVHTTFKNGSENFECCYRQIARSAGKGADDNIVVHPCVKFRQDFIVPLNIEFVIVNCVLRPRKKVVYEDAFTFVHDQRAASVANTQIKMVKRKPSILMIGIDALSRMNFRRNMPLTYAYLQQHHWYELLGYNKMGDNTFPNLMAVLTGLNLTNAYKSCKPTIPGGLDACHFIWNDFKNAGYYTAFAEDMATISTFNYLKKGFTVPPTDLYLRPLILAIIKQMHITKKGAMQYCVGRKQHGEYVYDAAMEVMKRVNDAPVFGLFWTNSFSHDYFDLASSMDSRMLEYFDNFERSGVMDSSIMIFFSDHGSRWGKLLELPEGFYEERFPMFFIHLPSWFRNEFPELAAALQLNQNRLTSPYDIYLTLQHVIRLFNKNAQLPQCRDCNKAQSLLVEVPINRTCDDVGISEHWCTCNLFKEISTKNATIKHIGKLIVHEINELIVARHLSKQCKPLDLMTIDRSELRIEEVPNSIWSTYRVKFKTKPGGGFFQTTVKYNKVTKGITVNVHDISRLNSFGNTVNCISDKQAMLFCKCRQTKSHKH